MEFDQLEFFADLPRAVDMDSTGFIYVPSNCQNRTIGMVLVDCLLDFYFSLQCVDYTLCFMAVFKGECTCLMNMPCMLDTMQWQN